MRNRRPLALASFVAALALLVAACGGSTSGGSSTSSSGPKYGGTFKLLGSSDVGIDIGTLLGGVIVTEQVFGLPGLGQLALQSVTNQDLPVIIGTVLLASFFLVVANVLVDMGYAILDPRVRPS